MFAHNHQFAQKEIFSIFIGGKVVFFVSLHKKVSRGFLVFFLASDSINLFLGCIVITFSAAGVMPSILLASKRVWGLWELGFFF
ncbi:MAG: hypothetical protein CM15mP22_5740 [Gammaproteobacteria bacterium]|nr:MAG: hypothetical protein CM15mP22_5740 [Gammaproteobacteria bacterium]